MPVFLLLREFYKNKIGKSKTMFCFFSKIDCKEQNGYSIKTDIGAGVGGGWGSSAPVRPSVCTPDMARYTPDQAARDRAWMNTCSSLSAAAQV